MPKPEETALAHEMAELPQGSFPNDRGMQNYVNKKAAPYLRDECKTPQRLVDVMNTWLRLEPSDPMNFKPLAFAVKWTCEQLGIAPAPAERAPSGREKQGDTNIYFQINQLEANTADRLATFARRIRGDHRVGPTDSEDSGNGGGPDRLDMVGQPASDSGGNG